MVLMIGSVALLALLAGWYRGPLAGVLTLVVLIASFFATLRVMERGTAVWRVFSTLVRLLAFGRELKLLRQERHALRVLVAEAVERFRPKDMEPLFPPEPPLFDASDVLS